MIIPKRLFRYFKERQHADEFVSGRIRVGRLSVYKAIDDVRKDELEGTSTFTWDRFASEYIIDNKTRNIVGARTSSTAKIKVNGETINPVYLICTSSARANIINTATKFGNYIAEIVDPKGLLDQLEHRWFKDTISLNGKVELRKVLYNRGQVIRPNRYLIPAKNISLTQKSSMYKEECEYRYIFWCRINNELNYSEYKYLDLGENNNVIKKNIRVIT